VSQNLKIITDRIALGTVQFGLNYGITGGEKVHLDEIQKILNYARQNKINTLDTAINYGDSERLLGEVGICDLKTVTKLPKIPETCENLEEWVIESVHGSLGRLKIPKLYGLLLHHPQDLLGTLGQELYSSLQSCKDRGEVQKIGISIYDPSDLDIILNKYHIDLIQAPFNVIDRRLETTRNSVGSFWLDDLHESGIEIHVRSIFLQGLLLMEKNQRPVKFNRWNKLWESWHTWLKENQISAIQACLNFVLSCSQIDRIVMGVENLAQLKEIIETIDSGNPIVPTSLICNDTDLINPSSWNAL
jgi:aryl-alcohol dehydrogenase-like predicted oxidoreductase